MRLNMKWVSAGIGIGFCLILPAWALLQRGEESGILLEGKGKEVVESVCSQCHSLSSVTSRRQSREEWEKTVANMIERGAQISSEEQKVIVDYLGEHLSRLSQAPPDGEKRTTEAGGGGEGRGTGLPDGPGKDVVAAKCSQCHGEGMWKDLRQDRTKWEGTLYRMVGKGALWTEEEIATMAQYLATVFGPKESEASQETRRQR